MKHTNININWTISSTEWGRYPEWKKEQLKQDRKTGLNRYYTILPSESESFSTRSNLIYRFDFTKPVMLPNTPTDWLLPEPYKFNCYYDIEQIIYTVGKSYPLFKFVNTIMTPKLHFNEFKYKNCAAVENILITIQITLVKNEIVSKDLNSLEKEIKLSLPAITVSYSHLMLREALKGNSSSSADYYQHIYFPLMLDMGYADLQKYEVNTKDFDEKNNHAWDYLTATITCSKDIE